MFNNLNEMLEYMEITKEYIEENMSFLNEEIPENGPFIVRDYLSEDFAFLASTENEKVEAFIDYLTSK